MAPVTFVFTHGIARQVLGISKAQTSTAKRRMIIAAVASLFPPTARPLPLGRSDNDGNGFTPVTFVFTPGIALQVLGNSKALTSTAKRRMISGWSVSLSSDGTTVAIGARYNDGNGSCSGHVRVHSFLVSSGC